MSLSAFAYKCIKDKLRTGRFPGGTMLSETTLAREIGASRTPVREAIAQLEREGLLDQIPRHGTFVRVMDRDEIEELYDLRATLEGFAAARAARHITPAVVYKLRNHCRGMMDLVREVRRLGPKASIGAGLAQRWVANDASFHTTIIHAAANRWLTKVTEDMRLMAQTFGLCRNLPDNNPLATLRRTWREHCRLLGALAAHDERAARELVIAHILTGKESLLAYCDWADKHRGEHAGLDEPRRRHLQSLDRYARITRGRKR